MKVLVFDDDERNKTIVTIDDDGALFIGRKYRRDEWSEAANDWIDTDDWDWDPTCGASLTPDRVAEVLKALAAQAAGG